MKRELVLLIGGIISGMLLLSACDGSGKEEPSLITIDAKIFNSFGAGWSPKFEVLVKQDSLACTTAAVNIELLEPGEDAVLYPLTGQGDGTYTRDDGLYIPGSTYTVTVTVDEISYTEALAAPGDISYNSSSYIFTWTFDGNNDYIYAFPSGGGAPGGENYAHIAVAADIDSPYGYFYDTYWSVLLIAKNISTGGFSNNADPESTFEIYEDYYVDYPPTM